MFGQVDYRQLWKWLCEATGLRPTCEDSWPRCGTCRFPYWNPKLLFWNRKKLYTSWLSKCCPYLQLGSWLHREAVWPHTQLFLKQTHFGSHYTFRQLQQNRKLEETADENFHLQQNPSDLGTAYAFSKFKLRNSQPNFWKFNKLLV